MVSVGLMDIEVFVLQLTILILTVYHCYHFLSDVFKRGKYRPPVL